MRPNIPDAGAAVISGGGEAISVWVKADGVDLSRRFVIFGDALFGAQIPQFHHLVVATGYGEARVGAEPGRTHPVVVANQAELELLTVRRVDFDRLVVTMYEKQREIFQI